MLVLPNPQLGDTGNYVVEAFNSLNSGGVVGLNSGTALNVLPTPAALTGDYAGVALSQSPLALWALNEANNPGAVPGEAYTPVYDFAPGHSHIGLYGYDAQNGYSSVVGPQPTGTPPFPGFAANTPALETTAADVNSLVTIPALNLNTNAEAVTITMWINPLGNVQANAGLLYHRTSSDAAGIGFGNALNGLGTAELGYNWNDTAGTYNWNSGLYPLTNVWSLVALVIQPTQATMYLCYVDTVANTTNVFYAVNVYPNTPEAFGAGTNMIGTDPYSITNRIFAGSIADVAVYNTALTSDQILAQFGAAAGISTSSFAPTISGAPKSGNGYQGETTQLSVTGALGSPTIAYNWQLDGTNISNGANYSGVGSPTLTIANFSALDVGTYQVVAANTVGTVVSSPGVLGIVTPTLLGQWLSGPASFSDQSGYTPAHDGLIVSNTTGWAWTSDVPLGTSGQSLNFTSGNTALVITNTANEDSSYDNTFDSAVTTNALTVMCWAKGWPGSWNPWVSKWGETTTVQGGWQIRAVRRQLNGVLDRSRQ